METTTLVIYDCEKDRIRTKVSETCLDYGLERIQFSAFLGRLSRSMREELFLKLCHFLDDSPARILVQPICEADVQAQRLKEVNAHLLGKLPLEVKKEERAPTHDLVQTS
jgi:CRISPR-associated protein Cas2